jgi:mono/diheme cytochrome c family protein
MRKVLTGIALVAMLGLAAFAQDSAKGEATFKKKCAGCHGADGAGKPAMKSPSIKGKSAEDITKIIASSPKHAGLKSLSAEEIKDVAAFLGTLK